MGLWIPGRMGHGDFQAPLQLVFAQFVPENKIRLAMSNPILAVAVLIILLMGPIFNYISPFKLLTNNQ